jgi:hypothetical protein
MVVRSITEDEVEEARRIRGVTVSESARPPHTGEVLVIRSTLASGRRIKVVVPADDESFVITVADQDEEDR